MFIQFAKAAIVGGLLIAVLLALTMPLGDWRDASLREALIAVSTIAIGGFLVGGFAVLWSLARRHDSYGPRGEYNPRNLLPFI